MPGFSRPVLFDRSRQELWLSNHITPYQCPSLVKLRQTLARRNSERHSTEETISIYLWLWLTQRPRNFPCFVFVFFCFFSWINVLLPWKLVKKKQHTNDTWPWELRRSNVQCSPCAFFVVVVVVFFKFCAWKLLTTVVYSGGILMTASAGLPVS